VNSPFLIIEKYSLPRPAKLIQVGASGGQELEEFVRFGITDALLIEPLEMPFSILKSRVENLPNYVPFQALAHSRNGVEVDFHVANNGGMSSSILEPAKHLTTFPSVTFPETVKLTGFRLDSIVNHLFSQGAIRFTQPDMLYLDVQGAELIVLHGAGEILDYASYIWTEVGVGDGYSGGASYIELIGFLATYGYQLVYFECAPGAFGDALFIKRDIGN